MNPNIKQINEHLRLVNFNFVLAGYIKELDFKCKADDPITFTDDGTIYVNESDTSHDFFVDCLSSVMNMKKSEIGTDEGVYTFVRGMQNSFSTMTDAEIKKALGNLWNNTLKMYETSCRFEQQRESLEKEYKKRQKFLKLKRLFRKE